MRLKANLYKSVLCILLTFSWSISASQTIADCRNPEGHALYHHNSRGGSPSFEIDKISNGMLSFQKLKDDSYDLLVVDSRNKISSMVQDGGRIILLRKGKSDATFILIFPGSSIELYTLWLDQEGRARLDMLQSRGGDLLRLGAHKSSLMTASCEKINFDLIEMKR
jgi:hypothetical protein